MGFARTGADNNVEATVIEVLCPRHAQYRIRGLSPERREAFDPILGRDFLHILFELGIIPPSTRAVRITAEAQGLVQLDTESFMDSEDFLATVPAELAEAGVTSELESN